LAGRQTVLRWPLTAVAAWAVLLLGGALRLYHLDTLSYWLDEGNTVYDTRRDWDVVLGFHGSYTEHPPLYHAVVKLLAVVFPDNIAARVFSFVSGTLTVVVLYFLVSALLNRRAAIVASLALAVSPVHIWYSQEARMYTPTMFAVATSYLMLVLFYKAPQVRWAVGYGLALLVAVYMSYSSFYALAPQVLLVLLVLWKHRRRSVPVLVAGFCAVLLYLPWLPQMLASADQWRGRRDNYLGPTPYRVSTSLLSVIGAGGDASTTGVPHVGYYWGWKYTAWDMGFMAPKMAIDPVLLVRVLILLVMGAVIAFSLMALWRRNRLAITVALLMLGTIPAAILASQVSAGYAERTILTAVIGWAMIVGGAGYASTLTPWPKWARAASLLAVVFVIGIAGISLRALYAGGIKQDWRGLAAATAEVAKSDRQVIVYPTLSETLLDIYQPQLKQGKFIRVDDYASMPDLSQLPGGKPDAVSFAYFKSVNIGAVISQFEAQGYQRRDQRNWVGELYLDTYALPGTAHSP
jgi:uncharacterized membrane protein